jgi:hypothetical protein
MAKSFSPIRAGLLPIIGLPLLAACVSFEVGSINAGGASSETMRIIDDAYVARDACLVRNASTMARRGTNVNSTAHAVALACSAETERLISVSQSVKTSALTIREDSKLRARALVLREVSGRPSGRNAPALQASLVQ